MSLVLEKSDVTSETVHVVVADDNPLVRDALKKALVLAVKGAAIREAYDTASMTRELRRGQPIDLILLDLAMPGVSGLAGMLYIRSQHPSVPVVVVSATEDCAVIRRCIDAGAAGFIPKSTRPDAMREAIRLVLAGEIWVPPDLVEQDPLEAEVAETMRRLSTLTPQQLRVLMMLVQGLLNKQIAYELSVSEATVKAHVSAILQKLGVESRTQAVLAVAKMELHSFTRQPKPR